jgi:hypothetical protein
MKLILSVLLFLTAPVCFSQHADINIEKIVKERYTEISSDSSAKKLIVFTEKGTIRVPENFTNKRTGTIDSERGELTGPGLMIGYDIGFMAGTHIGPLQLKEYNSYFNTSVNGHNTWIGLNKEKLVVTIYDPGKKEIASFPANFWATVKSENDVIEVLKIIFSYRLKMDQ